MVLSLPGAGDGYSFFIALWAGTIFPKPTRVHVAVIPHIAHGMGVYNIYNRMVRLGSGTATGV
jgi:hypothetical protein